MDKLCVTITISKPVDSRFLPPELFLCRKRESKFCCNSASRRLRKQEGCLQRARWIPWNRARSSLFCRKMFPNKNIASISI
ncbi:hypothetical protein Scep_030096 [Stephania cephalantha]|uniref:Uncharacterized protein n=1 Tax=Stephania cephalantha TaxID=152367 RepID=A0AAP0HI87_9MAGN